MTKVIRKPDSSSVVGRYRQILEDKAAELCRRTQIPVTASIVARREEPVDAADLCSQSHEEWIFLNCNSLDVALLRQVEDALLRLQEQTYGICQECGSRISEKRLAAVPWASYCLHCQDRHIPWHG